MNLLREYLEKQVLVLDASLVQMREQSLKWSIEEKWHLDTGKKFNELIGQYPISEDELIKMNKVICEFVQLTRITDIEKYFFVNGDRELPRLPYMFKDILKVDKIWHDVILEPPPENGMYYGKKDETSSMWEVSFNNGEWTLLKYPTTKMKIFYWAYWDTFD